LKINGVYQTFQNELGICVYSTKKEAEKELNKLARIYPEKSIIAEKYQMVSQKISGSDWIE
jgi:hypothetical protein